MGYIPHMLLHPGKLTNDWLEKKTMDEDVSPIKNADFPASHVTFRGG